MGFPKFECVIVVEKQIQNGNILIKKIIDVK
jgi:hypothetical protein